MTTVLVKYGEIALRGANRRLHEDILVNNIKERLTKVPGISVRKDQGRFYVDFYNETDAQKVAETISSIFGVMWVCICIKTKHNDLEHLKALALDHVQKNYSHNEELTFKVAASRADKSYPLTSNELAAELGAHLLYNMPNLKVNLKNPDFKLHVEVRNWTYIYSKMLKGPGGLPSGTGGKAVLLLSGGFDSPVAGYMMARRGMEIVPVYFHSPPYTSERARDKVTDIMDQLCGFIGPSPLYVVPFTETQLYIYEHMPHAKLTLFLKRAMLHIASIIAEKEKAHCLITGDSVGQVASQTAHSIAAVDSATAFSVLRPLAAMDKQQIIDISKQIGTYDISIRPYEDCCTVFVPKHPEHKPNARAVANIEAKHKILPELYARAAKQVEPMQCPCTNEI